MNYIPLHVKTSYSILTSLNDIKKMILFCKSNDIKTIAITDSNMHGVMEFYNECMQNDIKPIIGLEIKHKNSFILLYAKNYSGYQNLCRLTFILQDNDIDLNSLKENNGDLICISLLDNYNELKNVYKDIYLGYTDISHRDNTLTKKTVYINEILCTSKEDINYIKYLSLIKDSKKIDSIKEYSVNSNCYFDFNNIDYDNALDISNKCNIIFPTNNLMPKYDIADSKKYLFELCKMGLIKRLNNKVTKTYYDRLLYELEVIDEMGFNDYFLVVWDYVKYAKKNGILVGPGRGSAAGSLATYSLGITDIDPIKYDLLFERFLNKDRVTLPDIDIDFDSDRKEEVIRYVIDKYGIKKVCPIITFSTLTGKQAIRDIGRIYDISMYKIDSITKLIDGDISLKDNLNNKSLIAMLKDNNLVNIYKIAMKLEGLKRQISVHAAGIIISKEELNSYIPLKKYDNYYISGYSMEYLEPLGLIKMDFLSLKNLSMISYILNKVNMDFKDIPILDNKSLKLFYDATTNGIFQFESDGMKDLLRKMKPTSIDDVIAAIALFRPGPSNNINSYINRKNGKEKIDYIDPSLKSVLQSTYGIIIYQEQIIKIANIMAGYSYREADVLRRAISKKKKDVMIKERDIFIEKSIKKGYKKETSEKVFDYILEFANYGFNKAHSVSYSVIALKMAYLKSHYSNIFMSYLLTSVIGNSTKIKEYIDECKRMEINILKPNINESEYEFKYSKDGIFYSLACIKNVGSITCKEIVKERENGKFTSFIDFVKRMYNKIDEHAILSLIDADSFSEFEYNHNTLYSNLHNILNYSSLVNSLDESLIEYPIIEETKEFDNDILIAKELDAFGFYLSNHPVTKYKKEFNNIIDTIDISKYFDKNIDLILYINKMKQIVTKNNKIMVFITASDEYGEVNVTVFSNEVSLIGNINEKDIVKIRGKIEKRMSTYSVILQKIRKL